MQFFTKTNSPEDSKLVLVFGLGLIGRSISKNLKGDFLPGKVTPMNWNDSQKVSIEIEEILQEVQAHSESTEINVVWSAGVGSFSASWEDFEPELKVFDLLIQGLGTLNHKRIKFHLISSAGALYSGQISVTQSSIASPDNDYGKAKMAMEKQLQEANHLESHVYRISTVYGYDLNSSRRGLITTMMLNGIKNEVTTIFGTTDTLRDYVNVEDVGLYVSQVISSTHSTAQVHFLISGKPTSIAEIKSSIEKTLKRKLLVSYKLVQSNSANICFEQSLIPRSFKPTSLLPGINQLHVKMQELQD